MLALQRRRQLDWVLGKSQLVAAAAIVAFGAALKADPGRFSGVAPVADFLKWMQDAAWIVVVSGPIFVAAVQATRRRFGNPWALDAVQKLLDEFRADLFGDLGTEPADNHRLTLFKYRRWLVRSVDPRDWLDWLVAVARSDHLTQRRIRRFRAPDDAEGCQGIAGRAWRCKDWVIVPASGEPLPVLTRSSPPQDVSRYAKETWVDETWVRQQVKRKRPHAVSFAALQVLVKGRPWGVLVVDSRKHGTIKPDKLREWSPVYGRLLAPLLERI